MEQILVNGPINAVRLEGEVFGIKKIIYLFMDVHVRVTSQTECPGFDSMEFLQYLIKMFDISDKNNYYDLFLEINRMETEFPNSPHRIRYIEQFAKYFKHEFHSKNKRYPHIRLHYADIRRSITPTMYDIENEIDTIISFIETNKYITEKLFQELMNSLKELQKQIQTVYIIIFDPSNTKLPQDHHVNIEIAKKFADKVSHRYNHPELLGPFNTILESIRSDLNLSLQLLQKIIDLLNDSSSFLFKPSGTLYLNDYKIRQAYTYSHNMIDFRNFVYDFSSLFDQFIVINLDAFSRMMDIYFLRRLLDKDYITNAIVYTGASHSIYYIYFLVKYFNFKITNASYIDQDIHKVEITIKESNFGPVIYKFFFPPQFYQCSDLTRFPKGFS